MKVYQKPQMLTLSLSANDMLCSGCTTALRDSSFKQAWLDLFDKNNDGRLTKDELFTSGDGCQNIQDFIEEYCKFTVADANTLFWS